MHLPDKTNMRRTATSLLAFVLLLSTMTAFLGSLSLARAVAVSPGAVSAVLAGPESAAAGNKIAVTYTLRDAADIMAQRITLRYDPEKFTYLGAEPSDGLMVCASLASADGKIDVILAAGSPAGAVNGSKLCLGITFKVLSAEASLFELTTAQVANSAGDVSNAALTSYIINSTDRNVLSAKIAEAQGVLRDAEEGVEIGTYPDGTKAVLQAAVDAAILVRDNTQATLAQLNAAAETLSAALTTFEGLKITASTGDVNGDGLLDLSDLAVAAYYFGVDRGDESWSKVAACDINGDGRIGVYDMAFIALKLL